MPINITNMKKLLLFVPLILFSCSPSGNSSSSISSSETTSESEISMKLYIDDTYIEKVTWEDNSSVKALNELAKGTLTISMHTYGGFEQTGSIGQSIVREDRQIDVIPGDIVLYQGNQISVFYNSSSWSYTQLGHINLEKSELDALLNKNSITFMLKEN